MQRCRSTSAGCDPQKKIVAGKLREKLYLFTDTDQPMARLRQFEKYVQFSGKEGRCGRARSRARDPIPDHRARRKDGARFRRKSDASGEGNRRPPGKNLSPTISNLVWTEAARCQVNSILESASKFLSDLSAFSSLEETTSALAGRLQNFQGELFANWCDDTEVDLRDGELSMKITGQLMEIDVDGLLAVNFSERLAMLLRKLAFACRDGLFGARRNPPGRPRCRAVSPVRHYAEEDRQLLQFARNADNPVSKGDAVRGARSVSRMKLRTHDGREAAAVMATSSRGATLQCEQYVDRLQRAADRLSAENRNLRKVHEKLGSEVVALMCTDLLKSKDRWKMQWKSHPGHCCAG